jgi:integrase
MAQVIDKLTAMKADKLKEPGLYLDGGGLYLQVSGNGKDRINKSWLFRFKFKGRQRDMGLGSFQLIGLADAREKAKDCRRQLLEGIDPLEARNAARVEQKLEEAKAVPFEDCGEKYIAAHKAGWKNQKHAEQWTNTLKTYVYPLIGALPVQKVETAQVMDVLEPIWTTKNETAVRIRGRIEMILGWAKVRGYRQGDNPARWKDHLDKLLPKPSKVRKKKHHPALPYDEVETFMAKLRRQDGMAARALEFTILTAARTTETLESEWNEIEEKDVAWMVPEGRMKGERAHRVPLSDPAWSVIKKQKAERKNGATLIFPGGKKGERLSENAMLAVLDRMGYGHVTVHGFRSTFRDWAGDCTNHAEEVAELALAHANDDETEAAYRRSDAFKKRRMLMNDWAAFCAGSSATVMQNAAE